MSRLMKILGVGCLALDVLLVQAGEEDPTTEWYILGSGSMDDPWLVGEVGHEDDVRAWTNGVGLLSIEGAGAMASWLDAPAPPPWYGLEVVSVSVGEGVTTIGGYAFVELPLISFSAPSVVKIEDYGIGYCANLTAAILPSVETIGDFAFVDCVSLRSVTVETPVPPALGEGVFYECPDDLEIYVPSESVNAYKKAEGWEVYADIIQAIPEVGYADWAAANGLGAADEVTEGVENIFRYVFNRPLGTFSLLSISFENGLPVVTTPKPVNLNGVTVKVLASDSITDWSAADEVELMSASQGRLVFADGVGAPRKFFRLRAE